MSDIAAREARYRDGLKYDVRPELALQVSATGEPSKLVLSWSIGPSDASCWREPLTLTINPVDGDWETVVDLTREHMRVIRDFLTSMLECPDLREE